MLSHAVWHPHICPESGHGVPNGPLTRWRWHPAPGSSEAAHPPSLPRVRWGLQPVPAPSAARSTPAFEHGRFADVPLGRAACMAASVSPRSLTKGTVP